MFSYYRSTCNCPTIVRDELAISNVAGWGPVEQNCQKRTRIYWRKSLGAVSPLVAIKCSAAKASTPPISHPTSPAPPAVGGAVGESLKCEALSVTPSPGNWWTGSKCPSLLPSRTLG